MRKKHLFVNVNKLWENFPTSRVIILTMRKMCWIDSKKLRSRLHFYTILEPFLGSVRVPPCRADLGGPQNDEFGHHFGNRILPTIRASPIFLYITRPTHTKPGYLVPKLCVFGGVLVANLGLWCPKPSLVTKNPHSASQTPTNPHIWPLK